MAQKKKTVRIGGASGYWGDASLATPQLLAAGGLDFIVYDYLAEITMAILARARTKDPDAGYATDFITAAMVPNLREIAAKGVRIISNAGGVNPQGSAAALHGEIEKLGLNLQVAVVIGDDLMPQIDAVARARPKDMFSGADFPPVDKIGSANVYLGAFPIASALDRGADIVITGRCVDSAVTLGAAIHSFGWQPGDLDRLAGGSLAGHILECGPQATGGNYTDWREVADNLHNIGYPIAELNPDGSFLVSKPDNTGGLVSCGTVGEQMLYEIGDPQAYVLPDVVCDFSSVTLEQTGPGQVYVSGAIGRGVPDSYKTCLTWHNGFRGGHLFGFYGIEAEAKAGVFAQAAFKRSRAVLQQMNAADFSEVSIELIGAESQFGAQRQSGPAREVAAKIAVRHPEAKGIAVFLKEATGLALAAPPGLSGFAGSRPKPSPVMALFSYLTLKSPVQTVVSDQNGEVMLAEDIHSISIKSLVRPANPIAPVFSGETVEVPLIDLAFGRSGDKGDIANIGIMAREPAYLPYIWHALDEPLLHHVFGHFLEGKVERFLLPGSSSLNILLHSVLGGGGTSSLRNDAQGKGYAQLLLATPIPIAADLVKGKT